MAFTTQGSLLSAIRRGDEIGWVDFHNTYKRLIAICGKEDYGLNPNEVDELIQLVMIAFFRKSLSTTAPKHGFPLTSRASFVTGPWTLSEDRNGS